MKECSLIILLQQISGDIFRCSPFVCVVFIIMVTGNGFATSPSVEHLNITVENISYQGNGNYKVDIMIYNRSDKTIVLKEHRETFYVQTEILGRWKDLSVFRLGSEAIAQIPPLKGLQMAYIVNIPLDLSNIYTNSEGDVNMMFKYWIQFLLSSETDVRSHYGENSYWITPKTDTWILREGM